MDRGSNIVQEAVIKTIPKKNKYKKAKWLSEEALQIAEKRREVKGKGEKKRYTHLNAEFQRIARRDKKAFLRDQCKEIEENNRMGKTRDLFKKISDIKGIFHSRMGTIKDRNGVDLTEAENIKKRWQEYREEQYKIDLQDPDNQGGVITHLETGILECEVKWALASITTNKASRGDGIPVELFQILKDDAVKVLHSICQQIWKTQHHPVPSIMANRWGNNGNSDRLYFGGAPKSLQMVTAAMKLKDACSLEEKV